MPDIGSPLHSTALNGAPLLSNAYYTTTALRLAAGQTRHESWPYYQEGVGDYRLLPLSQCFNADGSAATNRGTWGTLETHWLRRPGSAIPTQGLVNAVVGGTYDGNRLINLPSAFAFSLVQGNAFYSGDYSYLVQYVTGQDGLFWVKNYAGSSTGSTASKPYTPGNHITISNDNEIAYDPDYLSFSLQAGGTGKRVNSFTGEVITESGSNSKLYTSLPVESNTIYNCTDADLQNACYMYNGPSGRTYIGPFYNGPSDRGQANRYSTAPTVPTDSVDNILYLLASSQLLPSQQKVFPVAPVQSPYVGSDRILIDPASKEISLYEAPVQLTLTQTGFRIDPTNGQSIADANYKIITADLGRVGEIYEFNKDTANYFNNYEFLKYAALYGPSTTYVCSAENIYAPTSYSAAFYIPLLPGFVASTPVRIRFSVKVDVNLSDIKLTRFYGDRFIGIIPGTFYITRVNYQPQGIAQGAGMFIDQNNAVKAVFPDGSIKTFKFE